MKVQILLVVLAEGMRGVWATTLLLQLLQLRSKLRFQRRLTTGTQTPRRPGNLRSGHHHIHWTWLSCHPDDAAAVVDQSYLLDLALAKSSAYSRQRPAKLFHHHVSDVTRDDRHSEV